MTFLRSHISIFILLLFILCSNYIFGQDLKGNNVILPATNSTVGSIKIGSWNALNMYGVKNIYVGNSGNFNSPASDSNAAFGYGALRLINNASRNVAIGPYAGGRIVNADGNVWIGNEAGNDSTFKNIDNIGGIDNSDTICPLIYFDFENNQVRICGTLDVNNGITGIDSVLWYLNGDTIINKSRHLVTIDSGLFLPHPQSNTRLGYVLAWEHTNGRVFPVEISQLSDTVTQVGVGYWELINGHLEPIDDIDTAASSVYKADHIQSFTDNYSMQDTLKYDFYIWGNLYDTVAKTFPGNPLYVILDGDFTWTELDTGWSVQAYGYCYDDGGYDYWRDEGIVTSITYDEVILKTIVLFNSGLIHLCVDQSGVPGDAYKKYDTVYFISPSVEIETPVRIIDSLYVEGNTKFNDSVYLERDAIPFLEPGDPLAGVLTLRKLNTGTERQLAMTSITNLIDTLYANGIDSTIVVSDSTWDLTNDIAIHVHPYPEKKETDPGYPYFYDDPDSTINIKYGDLYNWFVISDERKLTSSDNWIVPTLDDFKELANYLGANDNWMSNTVGGKLKESGNIYWKNPNSGATNDVGFNAKGSGVRNPNYAYIKQYTDYWTTTELVEEGQYCSGLLAYNADYFYLYNHGYQAKSGISIRLLNTETILSNGETGVYIGNDGRIYRTICIGNQEWIADNLAETKYRNGDIIPIVTLTADWLMLSTGARCSYNNIADSSFVYVDSTKSPTYTNILKLDGIFNPTNIKIDSLDNSFAPFLVTVDEYGFFHKMDTAGFIGGNTQLWRLDSPDTIKTDYNVVVDSSFVMKYKSNYIGYGDPFIGEDSIVTVSGFVNNTFFSSNQTGILNSVPTVNLAAVKNTNSSNLLIVPNFIEVTSDSIVIYELQEASSDYLVGWNSLTKQLVAVDSTGVVFHSEVGFYQEELSATKTIFNLGFTITSSALVSLNGVIINPSQWTGIGTSTLTLLLDTQQYDLFTIKQ